MSKFKIDDQVKMISYKGDYFYKNQVGEIAEDDLRIIKYLTGTVISNELHFYVVVRFERKDGLSQSDWWIHEDDLQHANSTVTIDVQTSSAPSSISIRKCDLDFLMNQFELDSLNGKKYTALLQHFIDNP